MRTPTGSKKVEEFVAGDEILSRDESDPAGEIAPKVVEEVFRRFAPCVDLRIGGQIIRTTAEHPFWVEHKGWCPVVELQVGDGLLTLAGDYLPIEGKTELDEWKVVYNLRVADWHTYFVGSAEWGFSVWAHNAICAQQVVAALEKVGIKLEGGVNHPIVKGLVAAYAEGGFGSETAKGLLKGLEGISANQAKKGVQSLNAADVAASAPIPVVEATAVGVVPPSGGSPTSVLQYGGHTINDVTAAHFGVPKREFGRGLEALKKDQSLSNDHHGNILRNGDYVDGATGRILGNIKEYLK